MSPSIGSIVEGQSEVEAIPVLLRRLIAHFGVDTQVARPFRVKRNRVVREGELERAIQSMLLDRRNIGCLLVILDADDDCPVELSYRLLSRCRLVTQLPVAVILANRELEAWFLGSKESLRSIRRIRRDAVAPNNPETIRGAKRFMSENMEGGRRYLEVDDQAAFAEHMDFEMARQRCRSFDKFFREIQTLVGAQTLANTPETTPP